MLSFFYQSWHDRDSNEREGMECKQGLFSKISTVSIPKNLIRYLVCIRLCVPFCPPEKCRSEEDLKSMDSRNKITQDMLQPKVEHSFSDEEGSSDYLFELSDNDSDSSDIR